LLSNDHELPIMFICVFPGSPEVQEAQEVRLAPPRQSLASSVCCLLATTEALVLRRARSRGEGRLSLQLMNF
jgi:hypothetical protein